MSEVLTELLECKFRQNVSLSPENCLKYIKRELVAQDEVAFSIHIPYEILKTWNEAKEEGRLMQGRLRVDFSNISYVKILNAFIQDYGIKIREDCERINSLLRKACSEVKSQSRSLRGRRFVEFQKKIRKVLIHRREVVKVADVEKELVTEKENVKHLINENADLQDRFEALYAELKALSQQREEFKEKLETVESDYEKILNANQELKSYVDKLSAEEIPNLRNTGREILDVGERQQRRKLKELKTSMERTLWFAETYGLSLNSASFLDKEGAAHTISFLDDKEKKGFNDLPDEEKNLIKEIVYIQDRFSIGDAAYHELTMTSAGGGLPRSYLIRQCKDSLNALCHIERTPGKAEGAQLNFTDELCRTIHKHVSIKK